MIVFVQESAKKDLKKMEKKEAIRIIQTLKKLEDYPNITNIKKLTNHIPAYRLRVGDYRVLFDVDKYTITVVKIRHRKESY